MQGNTVWFTRMVLILMSFLELSLQRCKEESGFGYARINFFLLPVGSVVDELQETDSDLDDDVDRLDPDTYHQELLQPVEWLQPS